MAQEARTEGHAASGGATLLKLAPRFVLCYAVLLGVMLWVTASTHWITNTEVATATAASALMNATGVVATRAGTLITVPGRQLSIGPDCTGISIAVLFVSLILAYPAKLSSKLVGALLGIAAILVANLTRLVAVAQISRAPDAVFATAHDFLFQVGMVVVAVAVWAYWLSFVRARES